MANWKRLGVAALVAVGSLQASVSAFADHGEEPAQQPPQEEIAEESSPPVTHIFDPAGDANGLNGQDMVPTAMSPSSAASYAAADLRAVRFETTFVALKVGDNGVDYQPTGLRIHISTEGSPRSTGPTLQFRLATRVGAACQSYLQGAIRGTASNPLDSADGRVEWVRRDAGCPGGTGTGTNGQWTAQVSDNSVILSFPYSSLTNSELGILGEGSSLSTPKVGSRTVFASSAAPQLDETAVGAQWVIGSDMPADIPCTRRCP